MSRPTVERFTIYLHTHRTSGKVYVGQTVATMEARWRSHVKDARAKNTRSYFHAAIRAHGPEAVGPGSPGLGHPARVRGTSRGRWESSARVLKLKTQ
jgi:hypothetical protein